MKVNPVFVTEITNRLSLSVVEKPTELIAIGCSAGGIEILRKILPKISKNFPVPIVIIQHRSPDSPQILQNYFSQICKTEVREPEDKEPIQAGIIYFAPTNYHLLIDSEYRFNLSVDALVNFSRPAIDVFFESAAEVYQNRMMAVILSGANADGKLGIKAVKERGGAVFVQDPKTASHKEMPLAASIYVNENELITVDILENFFSEFEAALCKK